MPKENPLEASKRDEMPPNGRTLVEHTVVSPKQASDYAEESPSIGFVGRGLPPLTAGEPPLRRPRPLRQLQHH